MFGEEGTLETQYSGPVLLRGGAKNFYRGGDSKGLYASGAIANIASFHASITAGDASNATVAPSVRSNQVAILGRTAAHEGRVVTWKELMKSKKTLKLKLDLKA